MPIDLADGSAVRDAFYLKFSDKSPAQIKVYWSKIIFTGRSQPPPEVSNDSEMRKFVAAHRSAIGYIEQGRADGSVKVLLAQCTGLLPSGCRSCIGTGKHRLGP